MTDDTLRTLDARIATAQGEGDLRDMEVAAESYVKSFERIVEDRAATGRPELFVNEFWRWSRKNPPSVDERTYLTTPEVMQLQFERYVLARLRQALPGGDPLAPLA